VNDGSLSRPADDVADALRADVLRTEAASV